MWLRQKQGRLSRASSIQTRESPFIESIYSGTHHTALFIYICHKGSDEVLHALFSHCHGTDECSGGSSSGASADTSSDAFHFVLYDAGTCWAQSE